jgi:hypothetical protein
LRGGATNAYAAIVDGGATGFVRCGGSGQLNVIFDYRWAENDSDRLSAHAADLVRRGGL